MSQSQPPSLEELLKRQKQLDEREAQLRQRESQVNELSTLLPKLDLPNYPTCFPLMHYDPEKDIPPNSQPLVNSLWWAMLLATILYIVNLIASALLLSIRSESAGGNFGIALMVLLLGLPCCFSFWFKTGYNALRRDSNWSWAMFFLNFGVHILANIVFAIGIPGCGGAGAIYVILARGHSWTLFFCCLTTLLFFIEILFSVNLIQKAANFYKQSGKKLEDLQSEVVSSGVSAVSGLVRENV